MGAHYAFSSDSEVANPETDRECCEKISAMPLSMNYRGVEFLSFPSRFR
jgi:hypothetical protein